LFLLIELSVFSFRKENAKDAVVDVEILHDNLNVEEIEDIKERRRSQYTHD